MAHFYYSFVLTMLHSLWQAAVLCCLYLVFTRVCFRMTAIQKRNSAYLLLLAQLMISVWSFVVLFTGSIQQSLVIFPDSMHALAASNDFSIWINLLFFTYLALLFSKLTRLGFSVHSFWKQAHRERVKLDAALRIFTATKALQLGIKKNVSIWYSQHIHTPLTYGFIKPVILLPFSLISQLSLQDTESLIMHELSHIKYNDYGLNLFLQAMELLFCFNPFVFKLASEIKLEREKNCDLGVLQFNYPVIEYAETLLQTARQPRLLNGLQLNAVFGRSQLLNRIRYFSDPKNRDKKRNKPAGLLIVPVCLFAIIVSIQILPSFAPVQKNTATVLFKDEIIVPQQEQNPEKTPLITVQVEAPIAKSHLAYEEKEADASTMEVPVLVAQIQPVLIVDSGFSTMTSYPMIPVKYAEADSLMATEVVITEQSSSGKTITRAYRISLIKGEWMLEPMWMIQEIILKDSSAFPKNDSIHLIKTDSLDL